MATDGSRITEFRDAGSRPGGSETCLTEQDCEMLQYAITRGEEGQPFEKEIVFGMTGVASGAMLSLIAWAIFKQVWFVWLQMPGWW